MAQPPSTPSPGSPRRPAAPVAGSIAGVWHRLTDQQRSERLDGMEADDLRSIVTSQPTIEQAKGILMGCCACDAPTAYTILVRLSQQTNTKLRDVAAVAIQVATKDRRGAAPTPAGLVAEISRRLA